MVKIGDRVGAIQSSKNGVCRFYGYGVYEGDEMPPLDTPGFFGLGDELEYEELRLSGFTNPKIKLDDGGVVWGMQCWWGSEESMKKELAKCHRIEMVDSP